MKLNMYPSPGATMYALISHILQLMKEEPDRTFDIAFSGGTTPMIMFDIWANEVSSVTEWERMRIWWVDERCVFPDNPDSNYGMMRKMLLSVAPIPRENIFRIRGEEVPQKEAERYSKEVLARVPLKGGCPSFDIVLLGIGNDGHTSSIFPGQEHLLSSPNVYEVSENPYNKQARIALTGNPILNARHIIFLVTGIEKANVISDICTSGDISPSAYIAHHGKNVEFFLDKASGGKLHYNSDDK